MYILQFIQEDNTFQCTSGFSWDGKPFWPEIRIYASQKSFNIHSTEKNWKSIIKQYYKYVLHICSIFTQNCLVSSWGPGFKKGYHDIMLVCSFRPWKAHFSWKQIFRLWQPDRIRDDILIGNMTSTTGFPHIPQPWISHRGVLINTAGLWSCDHVMQCQVVWYFNGLSWLRDHHNVGLSIH